MAKSPLRHRPQLSARHELPAMLPCPRIGVRSTGCLEPGLSLRPPRWPWLTRLSQRNTLWTSVHHFAMTPEEFASELAKRFQQVVPLNVCIRSDGMILGYEQEQGQGSSVVVQEHTQFGDIPDGVEVEEGQQSRRSVEVFTSSSRCSSSARRAAVCSSRALCLVSRASLHGQRCPRWRGPRSTAPRAIGPCPSATW